MKKNDVKNDENNVTLKLNEFSYLTKMKGSRALRTRLKIGPMLKKKS